jgi:hypothetical protein
MARFVRIIGMSALLAFLGVGVCRAQSFHLDDEFVGLLIEESDTVDDAMQNVNRVCRQEENYVRNEFNQEKNRIGRNLDALNRDVDRRRGLNKALRKFTKNLNEIRDECDRARKVIAKKYPVIKPISAPAVAITPPVTSPPSKPSRRTLAKVKAKPKKAIVSKPLLKPPVARPIVVKPVEPKESPQKRNVQIHGSITEAAAYRIDKPHKFTKNRVQALLQESFNLGERFRVKTSQRAFFDSVVRKFNDDRPAGSTTTAKNDLESEFEFREAYVDGSFDDVDIRVGLQQIVWGEAVALFVADVVNGKDLREYILPEFDWIRRPQWSFDAVHTKDALTLEGVISLPKFDKLGTRGSEFEFPFPVPTGPYVVHGAHEPESSLSNADYGARMGYLVGGLDLGLFFLHTWNKFPVLERRLTAGTLHFTPEHKRMDILGVTFSQDSGDSIVKGEFALRPGQPYTSTNPLDPDGIEQNMTLDMVLGIDHAFGKIDTNVHLLHTQEKAQIVNQYSLYIETN